MADGAVAAADEDAALDRWLGFSSAATAAVRSDELETALAEIERLSARLKLLEGAKAEAETDQRSPTGDAPLLYMAMSRFLAEHGPTALMEQIQRDQAALFAKNRHRVMVQGWVV